jgi:predicted phage terminase large subunit-like protein
VSPTVKEKHWDWWRSTAFTRLEPRGCAIIGMARWARDDLAGRVLGGDSDAPEPVIRVHLPALAHAGDEMGRAEGDPLWPEKWPTEKLLAARKMTGPYYWAALYDQEPKQAGRREHPEEWFGPSIWFNEWPDPRQGQHVAALDPSLGVGGKAGDYSAFIRLQWYRGQLWVDADLDNTRSMTTIAATSVELQKAWHPHVFTVEADFAGPLMVDEIGRRATESKVVMNILPMYTGGVPKEVRIRRLSSMLERGMFRFKAGSPGAKLLVQQLQDFPIGDHDDGPDALEMAVRTLTMGGIDVYGGKCL